ncbi:MAG: hypothetical protein IT433_02430 [Phycisphaerales bacterium]|nr:hypothetical protein [Phycisphaerales bacterium]
MRSQVNAIRRPLLVTCLAGSLCAVAQGQNKAVPIDAPKGAPVAQPAAQPAAPPADAPARQVPALEGDPDTVTLAAFSEPVALSALIEMVATTLNVNISTLGDVPGTVVFNAPVAVHKDDLLPLLASLLEQQQFTIVQDRFGWYTVHALQNVNANPGTAGKEAMSSTRVFRTPNMRPTALKAPLEAVLAPGAQGGAAKQYAYVDDLGVIIATDSPKKLDAVKDIIDRIIAEYSRMEYVRIDLDHITGSAARERALQLVGQIGQPVGRTGGTEAGQGNQQVAKSNQGVALDNLGDRLTTDAQGNALIFRGTPGEIEQLRKLLVLIDVPNTLTPRSYEAGSSAVEIANIARNRGLGEIVTIANDRQLGDAGFFNNRGQGSQNPQANNTPGVGGPVIVVDEKRGRIVYYGTPSQQEQLAALLKELDTEAEQIVLRVHKLRNAKAEDIQEILLGIIQNQAPMGDSLLPGDTQGSRPGRFNANQRQQNNPSSTVIVRDGSSGDEGFSIDSEQAFVIADVPNNQVIVKAPAAQQPEFARLIERLDLRRPQVYVEAKIVAVTADDRLHTAFETQIINASGTGGVFQQGFGLSTAGTGGTQPILNPRVVAAGLTGFTGAIIRSDQIPVIMTALANETDSRVIASPQLLVDDNENAKVATIDSQPVQVISRGTNGQGDIVTSGEDATAETSLDVTPHISDGGYMRLEYTIKLENFTGDGSQGLSPPKLTNNINSESITVPSDSTVVIGGLVIDNKTKTVAKIPLLGDIPLVGLLFQDRSTTNRKTVLYVFLTPRILRDPTFTDLKLLTKGPQSFSGLKADMPELKPSASEILWPDDAPPSPKSVPDAGPSADAGAGPSPD